MSSESADNISLNPGGAIPRAASRRNRFPSRSREKSISTVIKRWFFRATAQMSVAANDHSNCLALPFIFSLAPAQSPSPLSTSLIFFFCSSRSFRSFSIRPRPRFPPCNLVVKNGAAPLLERDVSHSKRIDERGVDNLFLKGRLLCV